MPADPDSALRVLELKTHQVSTVPGSKGLFSPRWSPDGRYIVAMPADSLSLFLFDFQTQKWSELAKARAAFPNWSRDGQYVYFLRWLDKPAVLRVRISDRKVEQVFDLTNLRLQATSARGWVLIPTIPYCSEISGLRMFMLLTGKSLEVL